MQVMRNRFRSSALLTTALALALGALAGGPALAVKKTPYPQVKVELAEAFKPDEAFKAMRAALTAAVAKKDAAGLFALVGPNFVWTVNGALSEDLDLGSSALNNFKVVFGFRKPGAVSDGGVDNGPFWDDLSYFVSESTFYADADLANLVCSPMLGQVSDEDVFEEAGDKVDTADDPTVWYFTLAETAVKASRDPKAATVDKVGTVALPLISMYPAQEGDAPPPATHLEVLLPSGKSGWIPISTARPMESNRLCYAKTSQGKWTIVMFSEVRAND
jgi:hypothetical protein